MPIIKNCEHYQDGRCLIPESDDDECHPALCPLLDADELSTYAREYARDD